MGAIFFYIFIYFVAYYATDVLNTLTVHPWITNRYIAALLPVFAVGLMHAYMIVASPPPQSQDITVVSAILTYIILPVIIVISGVIYIIWNQRIKEGNEGATPEQ